jgi:hypothetical protein
VAYPQAECGMEPGDYVKEAILDYLKEEQYLNFPNAGYVYVHLTDSIRNKISNDLRKIENRVSVSIVDNIDDYEDGGDNFVDGRKIIGIADIRRNPEEELIRKREREFIINSLKSEPIMCKVALLMIDYRISKPSVLAQHLGIPVSSVYVIKRRLLSFAKRMHEEMSSRMDMGDVS